MAASKGYTPLYPLDLSSIPSSFGYVPATHVRQERGCVFIVWCYAGDKRSESVESGAKRRSL
eukprot:1159947-Pelagomonas_calceolata.AAC.8